MQNYFRLYRKGREKNLKLRERLKELEEKERKVEKIFEEELLPEKEGNKAFLSSPEKALRFKTSQGNEIWVGKNAKSNHFWSPKLLLPGLLASCKRLAWLPRDFKIKNKENEEEEIQKAARVAAYFSSVRGESRAEVIVTQVKYVRTLPSQIGKVTYRREKLFSLNPSYPEMLLPGKSLSCKTIS